MILDTIPPDEDHYSRLLTELLREKMMRENPAVMQRCAHPKQHGLVQAHLEIIEDLPDDFACGVLQAGKSYQAWVRFSNQNATPQPDAKKDIRGAAIKLMNVSGEKVSSADGNLTSQDFVLISTPVFVTHDVREFFLLIKALVSGKIALLWHFLWHPRSLMNLLKSNKVDTSPLTTRYWSTTPYLLGVDKVVKYSLIPHRNMLDDYTVNAADDDYLRNNMIQQLARADCTFDFCIQVQKNPKRMPIEDPGKLWREEKSPFVKVATLTIPKQVFDTPTQDAYGRRLSFSPWHTLPAHMPLGGINRARRKIYNALAEFRHGVNKTERLEPTHFDLPSSVSVE